MKKIISFIILISFVYTSGSQTITKSDYIRAVSFLPQNLTGKKMFNINVQSAWAADSSGLLFVTQNKESKLFNKIDLQNMQAGLLFDHERLAKLLTDSLKTQVRSANLPFNTARYIDKNTISFNAGGKVYKLDLTTYQLSRDEGENELQSQSPDGKWIAYADNYNLYIKSVPTGEVKQLSSAGFKNFEYASWYGWGDLMEGENGERSKGFNVNWSPDSKWIQTFICDLRKGQKMYLLDWSVDSLYRARLLSYYRGSPGDTDMVSMTPVLFNTETGEEKILNEFRNVNQASLEWSKETGTFIVRTRSGVISKRISTAWI